MNIIILGLVVCLVIYLIIHYNSRIIKFKRFIQNQKEKIKELDTELGNVFSKNLKMEKDFVKYEKKIKKLEGFLDKAKIAIAFSEKKFQDLKNKKNICKRK